MFARKGGDKDIFWNSVSRITMELFPGLTLGDGR